MIIPGDPLIPLPGVLTGEVAGGITAVVGDRKPIILKMKNVLVLIDSLSVECVCGYLTGKCVDDVEMLQDLYGVS